MTAEQTFAGLADLAGLASALAVGILIGLERGWQGRELAPGGRIAGLRTFALTGLLGGVLGALSGDLGGWPLVGGLLALGALLAVAYRQAHLVSGNLSITSAVALLLTLALGAAAGLGHTAASLGAAVVATVLLSLKPTLHRWLRLIDYGELAAGLQLLVLSLVILPILPDTAFGPYQALNPRQLWLAILLIASLSLAGHLLMRITGAQRGVFLTGVLGGLVSSTAATLALARYAAHQPALAGAALAGVIAACGVMFLRVAVLAAVLAPARSLPFVATLVLPGAVLIAISLWAWRRRAKVSEGAEPVAGLATFDLGTAFLFGLYLALVSVLVPWAREGFGAGGTHVAVAVAGLADVDAITVAVTRLHQQGDLLRPDWLFALLLATLVNTLAKVVIAWTVAGSDFGAKLLLASVAAVLPAALVLAWVG